MVVPAANLIVKILDLSLGGSAIQDHTHLGWCLKVFLSSISSAISGDSNNIVIIPHIISYIVFNVVDSILVTYNVIY